jgi:hypothetical protein
MTASDLDEFRVNVAPYIFGEQGVGKEPAAETQARQLTGLHNRDLNSQDLPRRQSQSYASSMDAANETCATHCPSPDFFQAQLGTSPFSTSSPEWMESPFSSNNTLHASSSCFYPPAPPPPLPSPLGTPPPFASQHNRQQDMGASRAALRTPRTETKPSIVVNVNGQRQQICLSEVNLTDLNDGKARGHVVVATVRFLVKVVSVFS